MRSVTAQGSPATRFRRAIETKSVFLAELSAREMGHVPLDDAVGLLLLYAEREPAKVERATSRWLQGGPQGRLHKFRVTNVGQCPARRMSAWFVGEDGEGRGAQAGDGRASLMPGEAGDDFTILAPTFEDYSGSLALWLGWTDEAGTHKTPSDVSVPLQ